MLLVNIPPLGIVGKLPFLEELLLHLPQKNEPLSSVTRTAAQHVCAVEPHGHLKFRLVGLDGWIRADLNNRMSAIDVSLLCCCFFKTFQVTRLF